MSDNKISKIFDESITIVSKSKNLEKSTDLAKHYVAMSRAKVFLRIIYLD